MGLDSGPATEQLLERDAALAIVERLADQVVSGAGRVALVDAGPGLGKSALLDTCARLLAAAEFRVLRARGSELERGFPYAIVRQLLGGIKRSAELRAAVFASVPEAEDVLFGGSAEEADQASGEPFQIMNSLYWAIANLCDLGPVAVLVDDAHEADDASVRFLGFLARRLADLPVLLLVTGRPTAGHLGSALTSTLLVDTDATAISLDPLSRDGIEAFLTFSLGDCPDAAFVDACATATGGNPFYLGALIQTLRGRGLEPRASAVADLGPETVARRLQSRLERLPPAAVPLARACAVIGDGLGLPIYADLAQLSLDEAARAADALVEEGILAPGSDLAFLHPVLSAAVLADLGEHSTKLWHARAAGILESAGVPLEVVALHMLHAVPAGDPHVRATLVRAGRAAAHAGSPTVAARYLSRALEESGDDPDADLLYELGLAQASLGDHSGLARMAAGVTGTADPAERVTRAVRLANLYMRWGDLVPAAHILEQVRRGVEDPEQLLSLDATRYWAGRLHPDLRPQAMHLAADLIDRLEGVQHQDTPARRTLLAYLGCEAAQSQSAAQARELFARALADPGLLTFVSADAVAAQATMLSLCAVEDYDGFERLADQALAEAGRHGAVLAFLVVLTFRALVFWHRGDLAAAENEARETLRAAHELGWQQAAIAFAIQALAQLEQGDLPAATQTMAATAAVPVPPGFPMALMMYTRGRLSAALGDRRAALSDLRGCGQTMEDLGLHSPGILPWRSDAARLLLALDARDEARRLAAEEGELARRLSGGAALARALHAEAECARGAERLELLRAAQLACEGSAGRLVRAQVLVDLGSALRQERQPTEARTQLADGLELARRCGAKPLIARAREELEILGFTPQRSYVYGKQALTPSEARVARLAAAGRSNAEIAQQLFVTRKTVEKHLANVYRKLDIGSRAELTEAGVEPRVE